MPRSNVSSSRKKTPPLAWNKLSSGSISQLIKKYANWEFFKNVCTNPDKISLVATHVIIWELAINIFVIEKVPYTEIDWKAYMQECGGFLNGTLDYSLLKGDTGPLVYPAGFVYIYSLFYYLTGFGENIRIGQYIFLFIYLAQLSCVFRIYSKTGKVPPYVLVITVLTSYRIHSIYVLRLFNDPIAVLFLYISLNLFLDSQWTLGSVFYSLAVSVKMNILLYAPALLLFYLTNLTIVFTIYQLFICGIIQVVLALPFLYGNPWAYIKGSFDLGRVFDHQWTVNYRFLDVSLFENKTFHISLLVVHILLLGFFFPLAKRYFNSYIKLKYMHSQIQPQIEAKIQENKLKKLRSKAIPNKSSLKYRKNVSESEQTVEVEEQLSQEQKDFLKSFESTLKSKYGSEPIEKKKPKVKSDESLQNINFNKINQLFILPMFLANFIGIVCARSLHYQFYSWYFHSLPYLLWSSNYSVIVRFLILALIEFSWNAYPSTIFSSCLLHACHLCILWGVYKNYKDSC